MAGGIVGVGVEILELVIEVDILVLRPGRSVFVSLDLFEIIASEQRIEIASRQGGVVGNAVRAVDHGLEVMKIPAHLLPRFGHV